MTAKAQKNQKIDKLGFIQIKTFVFHYHESEKITHGIEKRIINHISDKELISSLCKELITLHHWPSGKYKSKPQ